MGNKFTPKQCINVQTHKSCIYQVVQLNNVELATCSSEKNIDIWNIETGLIDITLTGYSTPVTKLVYMHDGRLASGSLEKSIKIWTYDTHRCDFTIMAHEGPIRALIQLKDHNLASASDDKTVKVLDLHSMWFSVKFAEHKGPVRALAQVFDGRLVSGSDDKTIKIYDLKYKKTLGSVNIGEKVSCMLVVNKSGLLLVGAKKIKIFDMSNKDEYRNTFITCGKNIKIWNINKKTFERELEGHKGGTYGLEIMTTGKLVTSGGDGELKVWDIYGEKGEVINLKTGMSENIKKQEDKKDDQSKKVGKVTYAYKDDVTHHDLNKIEKNIQKHREEMNKLKNKKK